MMKSVSKVFALLTPPSARRLLRRRPCRPASAGRWSPRAWPEPGFAAPRGGSTARDHDRGIDLQRVRQSVALLADGSYASAWTERDGDDLDVRMQWVRPDGSVVFAGGGRTVAGAPENEFNAVVTANPAGGAFVAYSRGRLRTGRQVFVQSFDAAGNPRWPAGTASSPP